MILIKSDYYSSKNNIRTQNRFTNSLQFDNFKCISHSMRGDAMTSIVVVNSTIVLNNTVTFMINVHL